MTSEIIVVTFDGLSIIKIHSEKGKTKPGIDLYQLTMSVGMRRGTTAGKMILKSYPGFDAVFHRCILGFIDQVGNGRNRIIKYEASI